ncbi:hypothetical protein EUTSA_v10019863mg [Eutrema salsugineum]|uniref:Uncharacterized protein n=1 Tax=Eutrema salsugineum TaxID=72664 RepID=V4JSV0_EUTSA|nr:hypothetical protein EUTSA_v10019863mg [Eutrema salsugineum]
MLLVVVWPEEETETVVKWHCYSEENCSVAVKSPVETVEDLKSEAVPVMSPSKNSDPPQNLTSYHRHASGSTTKLLPSHQNLKLFSRNEQR